MTQDQPVDDLVRQAQQADEEQRDELLDRLVTQFAQAAYRWARLILDDEEKAYDAVQDAWLNAYLHLDQLRESAAFPGWFRQIVLSSCYRAIRGEKSSVPLSEQMAEEAAGQPDPLAEVENNERLEGIREAVQALPEGERVVTELYYFGEYSQHEIAELLAVPVTTIKKRLQYARRRLKDMIQPEIMSWLDLYALSGGLTADVFGEDPEVLLEWSPVGMMFAKQAQGVASYLPVLDPVFEDQITPYSYPTDSRGPGIR
jgi:RNA polymerase sigma factor (sigma-70 family)